MELDFAILADAVSAREAVVSILSGGVDTFNIPAPGFPVPAALAIRLLANRQGVAMAHRLEIRFLDQGGSQMPEVRLPMMDIPPNPTHTRWIPCVRTEKLKIERLLINWL